MLATGCRDWHNVAVEDIVNAPVIALLDHTQRLGQRLRLVATPNDVDHYRRPRSRRFLADDGVAIHDAAHLVETAELIVEGGRWNALLEGRGGVRVGARIVLRLQRAIEV